MEHLQQHRGRIDTVHFDNAARKIDYRFVNSVLKAVIEVSLAVGIEIYGNNVEHIYFDERKK